MGTANRMSAPYQAVKAKDGYFVLGANNARLWERLCNVIGRPDLVSDPRFATIADRLARVRELIAEIEKPLAIKSADEWVKLMLEAGVPAAPILNLADAPDSDQAKARGMVMGLAHPVEGSVRSLGFPVKFSATPRPCAGRRRCLASRAPKSCGRSASTTAGWRPCDEKAHSVARDQSVVASVKDGVASVVVERPEAKNAMSFATYDALKLACWRFNDDPAIRVVTFRGGGKAFAARTDISEFLAFRTGEDGVDYEAMLEASLKAVEAIKVPTIAVIEGHAVGGGLMLAQACDIRIAAPDARFGVLVVRTLGNCLAARNLARLAGEFGGPRVCRMIYPAELIDAEEARSAGFLAKIVEREALDEAVAALCRQIAAYAPVALRTAKEQFRRLARGVQDDRDLMEASYASADFHEGLAAFMAERAPRWRRA